MNEYLDQIQKDHLQKKEQEKHEKVFGKKFHSEWIENLIF